MSENTPVVLVTGVGPGTGAAIWRRFSLGGYRVAMLAPTRDRLDALQRELPNAKGYACDVTDEAQLDSAIEAVRRDPGTPKVLIHNAVGGAFANLIEVDPKVLDLRETVSSSSRPRSPRRSGTWFIRTDLHGRSTSR